MSKLHIFDLDDTLVIHDYSLLEVRAVDKNGEVFNRVPYETYLNQKGLLPALARGCWYDFSDFTKADLFARSFTPVKEMFNLYNEAKRTPGDRAIVMTARQSFDDPDAVLWRLRAAGLELDDEDLICVGDCPQFHSAPERKANRLKLLIGDFPRVVIYDDSKANLVAMRSALESATYYNNFYKIMERVYVELQLVKHTPIKTSMDWFLP
jgi:hypothetical protein